MNTNLCVLPTLIVMLGTANVSVISLPGPEEVAGPLIHTPYKWNKSKAVSGKQTSIL